jgi:hypothetical protein
MQAADQPVLNPINPVREPTVHVRTVFLFVECNHRISLLKILGLHLDWRAKICTSESAELLSALVDRTTNRVSESVLMTEAGCNCGH